MPCTTMILVFCPVYPIRRRLAALTQAAPGRGRTATAACAPAAMHQKVWFHTGPQLLTSTHEGFFTHTCRCAGNRSNSTAGSECFYMHATAATHRAHPSRRRNSCVLSTSETFQSELIAAGETGMTAWVGRQNRSVCARLCWFGIGCNVANISGCLSSIAVHVKVVIQRLSGYNPVVNNQPAKLIRKEKKEYSNREKVAHALQDTLLSTVSRTASENLQCRTQTEHSRP